MTTATIVFPLAIELPVAIAYDDTPPVAPDQAHAGPRLNRAAAAPPVSRGTMGPALNRESVGTRRDGSRGPTISREARD